MIVMGRAVMGAVGRRGVRRLRRAKLKQIDMAVDIYVCCVKVRRVELKRSIVG